MRHAWLPLRHRVASCRPAPFLRFLTALAAGLSAACVGDAPAESAVEVIDSAGVRVVVNLAPDTAGPTFRLSAQPLATIGVTEGPPEYQLYRVGSGRRLTDGTIVIANGGTQELRFYDATGTHIRSVGREGEGPGEFQNVALLGVFADDSLAVGDVPQRRYSIFDRTGTFVRSFPVPDTFPAFPPTVAGVLADGRLVVVTLGNVPTGPEDLASRQGIERRTDVVSTITPHGLYGARIDAAPGSEVSFMTGAFGPSSAGVVFGRSMHAAARDQRIVIATNDAYSIRVHDAEGRLLHVVRQSREPVLVQEGDFERSLPPGLRAEAPSSPMKDRFAPHFEVMPRYTTFPAFGAGAGPSLRLDAAGTLWVAEYQPAFGETSDWQAFDPEGVFLGRLDLPDDFTVLDFGSDWVLGRQPDEMDVERVVLYGLERVVPAQ